MFLKNTNEPVLTPLSSLHKKVILTFAEHSISKLGYDSLKHDGATQEIAVFISAKLI